MKTRSTQSANWVLPLLDRFVSACPVLCLWKPPQKINNICIERFHSYLGGLVNSLWHSKATLTSALQWLSFRKTSSLFSNKQKTETSSRFSNLDKQTNDKRRGYAATHQEISRRNGPWFQATKYYKSIYYIGSASIEFSAKTCHRADLEEAFTLFDRMGDGQIDAQVKKQTKFRLVVFCIFVFLYFCIFVFLYFCIFVFLYFCIFLFLYFCIFVSYANMHLEITKVCVVSVCQEEHLLSMLAMLLLNWNIWFLL